MTLKFQTPLAEGVFSGTQLDILPSTSPHDFEDVRLLLESEDEALLAYGDEVEIVEVEGEDG